MRGGTYLADVGPSAHRGRMGPAGCFVVRSRADGGRVATYFVYLTLERSARGRIGAPGTTEGGSAVPEEKFVLREAFSFDASFWFITLLCVTFYSAVFPVPVVRSGHPLPKIRLSMTVGSRYASFLILGR